MFILLAGARRLELAGALLILEPERHMILRYRPQKIKQILGVEPNFEVRTGIFSWYAFFA